MLEVLEEEKSPLQPLTNLFKVVLYFYGANLPSDEVFYTIMRDLSGFNCSVRNYIAYNSLFVSTMVKMEWCLQQLSIGSRKFFDVCSFFS